MLLRAVCFHPIRLAARPTRSSYSVFHITVHSWVGPGFPSGWLSGYQLADGPTRPSYSVAQVAIFLRVFHDRSQPSGKTKVSREDTTLWSFFFFCLLLILRFGDEVDFSAGFPARPVGSLGRHIPSAWLLILLGLPTPSSTSPFILGSDLGSLPAGFPAISWLMDLLGHPTQSPKWRFFWGFFVTDPSPMQRQRFLAKILHFDLFFLCCLLLILRFGDEVDFSAGFPARPVGSLGRHIPSAWLLVLLGLPTPSSTSPFILGSDLGSLPAGFPAISWLMDLLGHPTQSPKWRFFWGFFVTDPSPMQRQRFLAKILHFVLFFLWFFFLLLILRFGDEVDFSAGFPARQVGSLGRHIPSAWLLVLLGLPTPSSTSPWILGSDLGSLPAGFPAISWLMDLLGHLTQSPKWRFFWGFFVTDPSPMERVRFFFFLVFF